MPLPHLIDILIPFRFALHSVHPFSPLEAELGVIVAAGLHHVVYLRNPQW